MTNRWDETWHRLREWTNGQAPSERLAAQILLQEGYQSVNPSHPLGGKDGANDATCQKDGLKWLMAVYFPKGEKVFRDIKTKFLNDLKGVKANKAEAFVFVTNQELRLAERKALQRYAGKIPVELFHLERLTAILDKPEMAAIRKQFLGIDFTEEILRQEVASLRSEILLAQKRLEGLQTGGDTFCYWMLYYFDMDKNIARDFAVIRNGEFPLYDLHMRIYNMDTNKDMLQSYLGEISSAALCPRVEWFLPDSVYYRVLFDARNGGWTQDLILRRSSHAECWLAATRVLGNLGAVRDVRFEHIDNSFIGEFGPPIWRQ